MKLKLVAPHVGDLLTIKLDWLNKYGVRNAKNGELESDWDVCLVVGMDGPRSSQTSIKAVSIIDKHGIERHVLTEYFDVWEFDVWE